LEAAHFAVTGSPALRWLAGSFPAATGAFFGGNRDKQGHIKKPGRTGRIAGESPGDIPEAVISIGKKEPRPCDYII
jgi:hypothetical protein